MIERRESRTVQVSTKPVKIECDACGKDATGRRFGMEGIVSSKFFQCQRNTVENRVSERAAINETVVVATADLCEECAGRVADFITNSLTLLAGGGRRARGMRKVDDYGD